jgi:hypothetical protein
MPGDRFRQRDGQRSRSLALGHYARERLALLEASPAHYSTIMGDSGTGHPKTFGRRTSLSKVERAHRGGYSGNESRSCVREPGCLGAPRQPRRVVSQRELVSRLRVGGVGIGSGLVGVQVAISAAVVVWLRKPLPRRNIPVSAAIKQPTHTRSKTSVFGCTTYQESATSM